MHGFVPAKMQPSVKFNVRMKYMYKLGDF